MRWPPARRLPRRRGTTRASSPASSPAVSRSPSAAPGPATSFTLVATGDVLIHQDLQLDRGGPPAGRVATTSSRVLAPVAPIIRGADLAICHFETPVAPLGGPYRGYPSFAVQPQIIPALTATGFDECSTASNHSLDDGLGGVVRTLDDLDAAGIGHAGTYRTAAESREPQILDVHGVKVAHIAATYGLNGGAAAGRPAVGGRSSTPVPDVSGLLAAARAGAGGRRAGRRREPALLRRVPARPHGGPGGGRARRCWPHPTSTS